MSNVSLIVDLASFLLATAPSLLDRRRHKPKYDEPSHKPCHRIMADPACPRDTALAQCVRCRPFPRARESAKPENLPLQSPARRKLGILGCRHQAPSACIPHPVHLAPAASPFNEAVQAMPRPARMGSFALASTLAGPGGEPHRQRFTLNQRRSNQNEAFNKSWHCSSHIVWPPHAFNLRDLIKVLGGIPAHFVPSCMVIIHWLCRQKARRCATSPMSLPMPRKSTKLSGEILDARHPSEKTTACTFSNTTARTPGCSRTLQ
ncbi:hypothetical protein BDP55DRAFT_264487 [Colletotrichum godetiae]|uniref:Uncharacterized protein n=1 Tax=Colletotrichum godetiae TaxID=1209918 RepID=A0AAJ0F3D1_9PEZI|nr:uncharacterized protein BDP55DRAFT_264487 [Colletotrichum godetiae]KAK1691423.1 hypothetical protein BDP55DRAFT_264487 [Colletotrichum godetiae]